MMTMDKNHEEAHEQLNQLITVGEQLEDIKETVVESAVQLADQLCKAVNATPTIGDENEIKGHTITIFHDPDIGTLDKEAETKNVYAFTLPQDNGVMDLELDRYYRVDNSEGWTYLYTVTLNSYVPPITDIQWFALDLTRYNLLWEIQNVLAGRYRHLDLLNDQFNNVRKGSVANENNESKRYKSDKA